MGDTEQAEQGAALAAVEVTVDSPAPADDGEQAPPGAGREAAKYRRRLRDAEAREASLATRLEAAQRREAEQVASRVLARPACLWVGGAALGDVLGEDGQVDPEKVEAVARAGVAAYGFPEVRVGGYVAREGTAVAPVTDPADGMERVIRGW